MNRRSTLLFAGAAATAGVLAIRPALAQTGGATRSAGAVAGMSPDQVRAMALGGMAFALATSEVALQRASNATVKTFAELESEEQRAFAQARQLAGLQAPSPNDMDAQKRQMLQQLQGLSGAQFDRMYVEGQVMGHQELLALHQAIAQSAPVQAERMLGIVAVPAIKSHLAMLRGIETQMRG